MRGCTSARHPMARASSLPGLSRRVVYCACATCFYEDDVGMYQCAAFNAEGVVFTGVIQASCLMPLRHFVFTKTMRGCTSVRHQMRIA